MEDSLVQTLPGMTILPSKKSTRLLLLVLAAVFLAFVVRPYRGAVQENRTRRVAAEFGAALHELPQTSPGIARVETFMERLRAIDTKKAPPAVRQALEGYIAALTPSVHAARAGKTIVPYDKGIAQARQRLADAVRENE